MKKDNCHDEPGEQNIEKIRTGVRACADRLDSFVNVLIWKIAEKNKKIENLEGEMRDMTVKHQRIVLEKDSQIAEMAKNIALL